MGFFLTPFYKERHKDTLSYDMVKRIKDVENEGMLMGML